ncbi:Lrp/AsnC family transcriptional regulator [Eleftheria terrae]|uniref:Lrp/AsnC family transcriptional regulator n=1 Tax=Eleftheria terrae TaxID=1597781 RepID=UPI00263B6431|nr:Lrp/AsnC family transcriptional regulator [Eleftheria terrae]WKB53389.1 Lrp/AsnC family transcriptional regulator [Eleftheria terrae]
MESDAPSPLDRTDRRLLDEVQRDARLTTAQLADRVSLSTSPCWRRLKRLEEQGVIQGYHARLDAARLGWGVTAFVHIMMESHNAELGSQFEDAVMRIPEVVACHNVSGQYDFLLQVVARDLSSFGEFARSTIRTLPGVKEMNSSFSLKEVKAPRALPV